MRPVLAKYAELTEYPPFGAKYDATYVVPAVTGIGDEKSASCQPDAGSLVKVTWPSGVPLEVQRSPM